MKSAKILREKINSQAVTTGALVTFHYWPGIVEMSIRAGLDYLIIDLEHLTHNHEQVAEGCAIGRMMDFPVLIRPPQAELVPLRLAMDLGPCGLLVPYVESVATMDLVRDQAYLKPRGKRRPGGLGNLWVKDYNYATWKREVEDDLIIIPQIESKLGLAAADDIARHEVTTAIGVGPYDLSADLGCCWDPEDPREVDALARIRKAGRDAGKNMWMIGDASKLVPQGFTFLCIAEPIMLLEASLRNLSLAAKQGRTAPGSESVDKPLP